jgi:FkbM family methyltransferase
MRHTLLGRGRVREHLRHVVAWLAGGPIDYYIFGLPIRCYLDDNRCEWKAFLKPDRFDPQERRMIAHQIDRADAVFLDIGANIGLFTLTAASIARPDARIVAFEPHPVTFERLAFNVKLCGHPGVIALPVALGAQEGQAVLAGDDLSLSSLAVQGDGPVVRVRRLIDCLNELSLDHIDAMKIDVEGYEDQVLECFLADADDGLLPGLVIIEHLDRASWRYDCIKGFEARGLKVVGSAGNNTFLAR